MSDPVAAIIVLVAAYFVGAIPSGVIIGRLCEAAGIPSIMHCGHDLGPKTAAMLHVAATCPAYSLANDSTYYGLEHDILIDPFKIDAGTIMVPTSPGLGCDVDIEMLRRYQIDC